MKTPYFLIHRDKLDKNIKDFQDALTSIWPNSILAYSVKTNSLPWILTYMNKNGVYAEVVSDEEYELAKCCGYSDRNIVFNGPTKGEAQLKKAFDNFVLINFDSQKDIQTFIKLRPEVDDNIGLRVNINPGLFCTSDIGGENESFRFGYSDETGGFEKALKQLRSVNSEMKIGLHLHFNSITRSLNAYRIIAKYAAELIKKYNLDVSYIDIGGGFFGGVPGRPTPYDYMDIIRNELDSIVNINETKLIVEPGSALIGSVFDLITTVIDVKDTATTRIITTDGSRIHIDPLWIKNKYMYSLETREENTIPRQLVAGYTCINSDRLMVIENDKELSINDKVIYHRVGAYSVTLGGPFIRYFPEVYVKDGTSVQKVRKRMSVEDYLRIQSI